MKQIIKRVLEEISTSQVNLTSASARDMVADEIESALKVSGDYKKMTAEEIDIFKAKETWVCGICGKNTYGVDWDYIGSGTNHLGCELEQITQGDRTEDSESPEDLDLTRGDKRVRNDRRKSDRREKNYSQKKHEDKVFGKDGHREHPYNSFVRSKEDLQKQVYVEMTTDGLPEGGDSQAVRDSKAWVDKLTEEIVTDNDTGYIYESPDGGKTVYKRKEGSDKRELVKDWEKKKQGGKVE